MFASVPGKASLRPHWYKVVVPVLSVIPAFCVIVKTDTCLIPLLAIVCSTFTFTVRGVE